MGFFDKLVNAIKEEMNDENVEDKSKENIKKEDISNKQTEIKEGDDEEIIAILSAAIAEYLGTYEFTIKTIKRTNPYSLWTSVGREELIHPNI